jgi:ketosteroid isomerase-like protein
VGAARPRALTRIGLLSLALISPAAAQNDSPAQAEIRGALTQWMTDFNVSHAEKTCALFAPDLVAQVRGRPERGYAVQCDLLKSSLADPSKTYRYALAIKEIIVSGDLAVVRLTWTLTVKRKDSGAESTSDEYGLDVFRRQADGSWKIALYMSYDTLP